MIAEIDEYQLTECLQVLHRGYETVAVRFHLTNDNCPYRGRADLPLAVLTGEFLSGIKMYGYRQENRIAAFVSMNIGREQIKLNDVVVLPEFRHRGIGTAMLNFAKSRAIGQNIPKVSLGMIDDNKTLREWYERNGFVNIGYKKYPKAPFAVGYMEWKNPHFRES